MSEETIKQSIISDLITFGLMAGCILLSKAVNSAVWEGFTIAFFCITLFVYVIAGTVGGRYK